MALSSPAEAAYPAGDLRGEVTAYVQPLVQIQTGSIVGVELLARWQHPTRGVLSPGQFLPLLDMAGRLPALTDVMLDYGSRVASRGLVANVNASADDFTRQDLVERVEDALSRHSADRTNLCLEVIEVDLDDGVEEVIKGLRASGIQVAIDDFGTAFSSLARVIDIQVNLVKLDRSLVTNLDNRPRARILLRHLVEAMHDLGAAVLAEGIETVEELDQARLIGCDLAQGFLFGRPIELELVWRLMDDPGNLTTAQWRDIIPC